VAALGWTWNECRQHWGKPECSETQPDGQFMAIFEAHDLSIMVFLTDGKVARIFHEQFRLYFGPDGSRARFFRRQESVDETVTIMTKQCLDQ
jgi:hypothetical protein